MSNIEWIIIVAGPIITVGGIVAGVWQFNKGQKNLQKNELRQRKFELEKMSIGNEFEAIAKFKEIQLTKYMEAAEIVSNVVYAENYKSVEFKNNLKRFWQLYWVELSSVEDSQVESKMKDLGDQIEELENRNFENISTDERVMLKNLGYEVAQAIKKSSKNWELPGSIAK